MSRRHDWQLAFHLGIIGLACKTCGKVCYLGDHVQYDSACALTMQEKDAHIRRLINEPKLKKASA